MKKKKVQPVDRTRETVRGESQASDRKEEETIHNGSANAFETAEGIPVDRDEEDEDRRDDKY
jgi:hypothetical protein